MSEIGVPVRTEVDLLVLGGTSGAVACALAAKARGLSVFLVAPRPYLGEDICAAFDYWPGQDDESGHSALAGLVFPKDDPHPPSPMHVKHTLEQALLEAELPFLLNAQVAGVLKDQSGLLAGAMLAHRGGRDAVVARQMVDASVRGDLARQAGVQIKGFKGKIRLNHVTLGGQTLKGKGLRSTELAPMQAKAAKGSISLPARRYSLELEVDSQDPKSLAWAQAELVERCWAPGVFQQSESLDTTALDLCAEPGDLKDWPGCRELSLEKLEIQPRLFILGRLAPLSPQAAGRLARPLHAMAVGERLGKWVQSGPGPEWPLRAECAGSVQISEGDLRQPSTRLTRGKPLRLSVKAPQNMLPVLGAFDVVVVGGGTGGAPAAIAAARAGATTLVCEFLAALGGVGTLGQIASYYFGNRVGFTTEIDAGVAAMEEKPFPKAGFWTPGAKQAWLHRECHRLGVQMWFATACVGAWVEDARVRGVVLAGPWGYGLVHAKTVIDATGSADVAAAAGAEVAGIGADHVAVQGTGLAGIRPGRHYHNTDHTFSDDGDPEDATQLLVTAKTKFKDHFDGGQLVDSRERRQIIGEYSLSPYDFLCGRRYRDTICISSSDFDSHGFSIHPLFLVKAPDREQLWVRVPFRCLLPRGLEGLLVTGLGISAHRDAIPVVRMQADVQNQGYAAGLAAAWSSLGDRPLRMIDFSAFQKSLVGKGILPAEVLGEEETPPLDDEGLVHAVETGWDRHAGLAAIFQHPERALPLLRSAYDRSQGERRLRYAEILAFLGDGHGREAIQGKLDASAWDEGWRYRGMGQFGASVSPVDTALMALGKAGDESSWQVLFRFARLLPRNPEFSHCRAVAESFESLYRRHPHEGAADLLAELLSRKGMAGHAQASLKSVQSALTHNPNETQARELALREIYLARSAYACGMHPLGKTLLRNYVDDLRGHFARHARAVLGIESPQMAAAGG